MMKYLTRAKKDNPELPDVFPANKAPIPPKTQTVEEVEAINAFIRRERQQKADGGRIGFKNGPTVKFDNTRDKIPTGEFIGEGRDKSQIFKIKNNKTGSVRYTTTGAGGGIKKLYKSIKEVKDAKLKSLPDEFFVQSETPYKDGIKEVTYKNKKTGETKVFYKPRVGPNKTTIPGRGAETLKEAQTFVDNYFKENPKQVRVRDPKKKYDTKDRRAKALEETDRTKAAGTKKYNYHHIRQIAGGVPLTTDDVLIINQRINSKIGGKFNESLNRISAAIRKNNRLALEAMNNKQEGLALDYMKRSDELNAQAEKIVNSAIDKLPKKYKGYVGFNQFTLPRDEYGLPIQREPIIVKKIGGTPVSKDAIDLTTLDLKQEKEFRKIVKAQAERGEVGPIKIQKLLASFGDGTCAVQFGKGNKDGGRIGYATGPASLDDCIASGAKNFNDGKFKTADQVQDAAKLLRGGRAVVGGLMKYGIIPELAYVGLEAAGRTLLGEQPTNALLKSIDTLTFGATDFGSGIEAEKFGKFSDQKLAVDKFRNSQALVNSLQSKLKNLEDISNQGGEDYIGDLTSDIQMTQAQLQTAQKAVQENTVSSDIVQFIDRKGQEIADTQMAKSNFAKQSLKDQMEGIPGIRDYTDTESTRIFPKQPSQMDLNLNMFPTLPTDVMQLKTSDAIDLAQALRAEGQNVSAKDILAYRDDLKQMPLSQQAEIYGDEQVYGTQGANVLQPLAGGGIAKIAGVDSGPPPESGPNSQGLLSLKNRVRNY